ncbi:Acyltransferase family [Citrobacter koseri]|uniref:acyltransferase family protein n=1 Tax=Citrobacter koseri TaxID=545 RepID=UPI000E12CF31|nr:acyltransferase [Citrobacter koseri]SUX91575.1 Acyltransferase family [Citrobacter koseri]
MLKGLQYLRGIAAVMVVLLHARISVNHYLVAISERQLLFPENHWAAFGRFGVDIFFVISGFVISITLFKLNMDSMSDIRKFIRKRIIRVAPLFWVCLITYIITMYFTNPRASFDALKIFTGAVFQFYSDARGNPSTYYGVSWTLNYEMLFYMSVGMFVIIFRKYWAASVSVLFLCTSYLFYVYGKDMNVVQKFVFNPITLEFILGVLVAHIYNRNVRINPFIGVPLIVVCFLYIYYIPVRGLSDWYIGRTINAAIPAAIIVMCIVNLEFKNFIANKILMAVGDSSYSLYLVHSIIFIWLNYIFVSLEIKASSGVEVYAYFLFIVMMSILLSVIINIKIEKPMLKALNGYVDDVCKKKVMEKITL